MEIGIAVFLGLFIMSTGLFATWQFNRDTKQESQRKEAAK